VSKVLIDNRYYEDLLNVKFEFWLVYINHIYVFLCIHMFVNKPYVVWITEQN